MMRVLALLLTLVTAAPSWAEEPVHIDAVWARATILPSRPGAAYLTVTSPAGDRLVAVETPVAEHVMMHATEQAEGVNRMRHLDALGLPPGQPVTLTPGGTHLMLMGLRAKLVEGERFPMTLRFEAAGEVTIEVPVLGIAASGPEADR